MESSTGTERQVHQTEFAQAIEVTGSNGSFMGHIDPTWDGPVSTHGGVLGALMLQAVDSEIADSDLQIRSLTCHYLRPPKHGEVRIEVDVLRRGRRFATSRATMFSHDKPTISALATHSVRDLPVVEHWSPTIPFVAPPPDRNAPFVTPQQFALGEQGFIDMPEGTPEFFRRLLYAPRIGTVPFVGQSVDPQEGTSGGGWLIARTPCRINVAYLAYIVDILWPSVLSSMRTPVMAPTLDLTTHFRATLPLDGLPDQPLFVQNSSAAIEEGLADSDSRVFDSGGRLLAQGRQLHMISPLERP